MVGHIMAVKSGTYKKAHRHEPGAGDSLLDRSAALRQAALGPGEPDPIIIDIHSTSE